VVQSCRMWCAVCTLPHSHKFDQDRSIIFMLATNRPTPVLSAVQLNPGISGEVATWWLWAKCVGMKDWRESWRDWCGWFLVN